MSSLPSFPHSPARCLIRQAGLADGPEFEERNGQEVSMALMRLRGSGLSVKQRNVAYNEIAALYMPDLVAAFKRQRAVNGAATSLLAACSGSPHFYRYVQTPAAQDLHKLHIQRLLANVWNASWHSFGHELLNALQFLSTLFVAYGFDIDQDSRRQLVWRTREWKAEYAMDADIVKYAERCLDILHPIGEAGRVMHAPGSGLSFMRNIYARGSDKCNYPDCTTTSEGTNFLCCSKCKLKYCCADHQKRDWKAHKPFCLTSVF